MVELRPYQTRAIESLRESIRRGNRRILLNLPTGAGKTLTAATMVAASAAKGKRCLFVAHRKELIDQTVTAFARLGIFNTGVIRASDRRAKPDAPIQIASIQTLARRRQEDFDLVIVDEAHRSMAKGYQEHLFTRHANAVIIGLSATPCRSDGKPLGSAFQDLVVGTSYSALIRDGHLVEPTVYSTPVMPDLSGVHTQGGDYKLDELADAVNTGALVGDLFTQWNKHPRQRTVAFAVNVKHSRAIVDTFTSKGVRAEHLDGTTPEDERGAILARLASGETELVSNVGVLTEGWDLPSCKTIILARPTKSLALYMQMAGRTLRPWEGVTSLVLDHGGNVDRHGLPHEDREWSLTEKARVKKEAASRACPECFAYIPVSAKACPYCNAQMPAPKAKPKKETQDLSHVDLQVRTLRGEDARYVSFMSLYRTAKAKGWKYGAIIHRYRERWGEVPPKDWVDAIKHDFQRDREWRDAYRERVITQAAEWWTVLGVERYAPLAHIKASYRELALRCHPDHGGSEERMKQINLAWEAAKLSQS